MKYFTTDNGDKRHSDIFHLRLCPKTSKGRTGQGGTVWHPTTWPRCCLPGSIPACPPRFRPCWPPLL